MHRAVTDRAARVRFCSLCRAWKNVQTLRLRHCALCSLPSALRHLVALQELSIGDPPTPGIPMLRIPVHALLTLSVRPHASTHAKPWCVCVASHARFCMLRDAGARGWSKWVWPGQVTHVPCDTAFADSHARVRDAEECWQDACVQASTRTRQQKARWRTTKRGRACVSIPQAACAPPSSVAV